MDIRTRIKKMVSGEIDVDEYEKEYTDKIRKKEADRISKSIKENTSNISINLPTQNISLPTASSRSNLKIPSYRQTSSNTTLSLPKARLDTSVDFNDLELITRKDLEARQEAERINRDIERGDYNSSISHVLNSFPEGIKSGVAGIANAGMIPLAGVLQRYSNVGQRIGILKDDNIFNKAYNSILDASDYLTDSSSYRNKVGSNISNNIVKTAGDVSLNVGQMMPAVAANLIAPGTGLVVTGLSAGGNSAQETINNDRSNLLQATLTGTAKGFVEAGTEKLTGGNIISKTGSLDNVVNKTISSKIKSNIGKEIANRGYQFVGEMAEEQISNNAGYVIDKIINNKDLPDAKQWWNDFSETNKVTFLTTLALNMVGLGGGSFSDNVDTSQYTSQELQEADKWFNEAKKIIEQENRTQNNNTEIINQLPTERNSEIVNNIANNQETLYNNIESESGINGERQNGQGTSGILGELGTRLQQEEKSQQNKKYSRTEYEQWEQSIRPITNSQLTQEQRQLKNNIKRQYGKDIVFFDGNKNDYNGGASLKNTNNIYINRNDVNEFGINKIALHEVLESNIAHNQELKNDIINPTIKTIINDNNFQEQKNKFWEGQEGDIPSDYMIAKDILCDRFSELKSGEKLDYDNVLSQETNMTIDFAIENFENQLNNNKASTVNNNTLETGEYTEKQTSKTLNPTEISNLKQDDANTTPKLKSKNYERGNKKSNFFANITEKSKFLNEDFRNVMKQDENIEYYKTVSNKETLEKAYNKLQEDGEMEVVKWHSKDSEKATTEDVAEGWILLKQYQDSGDYESAVEVAKKMREIGTKAGQTVQAYNIFSRLTPEGMFYYAQSELSEAYSKMVEGKSKKWIDANKRKFDLTPEETKFIMDTMQEISTMPDGYNKKVKLAEIQKVITDKIPATTGQSIKAWMRISMLFNPKTQVRNIMGNAVIMPVNMFGDSVSAGIDRLISKKTGIRTTGNTSIKNYAKGFGKGLYESYNDFKKGINTRNIQGNRFEVSEGRNFNNKGLGKALNRVDNLLSFMLDAGDRGFYEATFTNSINNQLVLNNTTEVTQEMIDIATTEALQRTWQDNNTYTQAVLKIRNILNGKIGKNKGMNYGIGDVLIPFAKTPANLTKAIVDYSPVGLVKTLTSDAIKLKNSLENGQYTSQLQHKFVQNLGKATAGSFLYVLGYALAQAGVTTGEADEDKDIKNFMKNSLGISSYSIKIGDKSFTYDWAQPIAAPFAFMANFTQKQKDNPEMNLFDTIGTVINTGTDLLFEQSFMESINTVLNGSGTVWENFVQSVLELPSRAIPTFSKQIADMVDSTQRTSFEYDKPIQSAINSVIAKIPGASKQLPASVDTLGNEIQKYGGENNLFNVFLNPANMNKGQLSKAGEEIYNVYKETGDTTIFPRTAPYYINNKGEKITMTSEERSNFQKISGTYVEDTLEGMLKNDYYKKLSNEEKAELINQIVSDSYSKAKYDVLKIDSEEYKKLRETLKNVKTTTYYDYKSKTKDMKTSKKKMEVLVDSNYSSKETTTLYENYILSDSDTEYPIIKETFTNDGLNIKKYLRYKTQEFTSDKKDDGTLNGKVVSGSKKNKVEKYLNSMDITYMQRLLLYAMNGYSTTSTQKSTLVNYINSLDNITDEQRLEVFDKIGFTVYKDGTIEW